MGLSGFKKLFTISVLALCVACKNQDVKGSKSLGSKALPAKIEERPPTQTTDPQNAKTENLEGQIEKPSTSPESTSMAEEKNPEQVVAAQEFGKIAEQLKSIASTLPATTGEASTKPESEGGILETIKKQIVSNGDEFKILTDLVGKPEFDKKLSSTCETGRKVSLAIKIKVQAFALLKLENSTKELQPKIDEVITNIETTCKKYGK